MPRGRKPRNSEETPLTTKVENPNAKQEIENDNDDEEDVPPNEVIRRRQPEVLLNMDLIKALIAPYTGRDDCEDWIERLENFRQMYGWSDLATMTYAITRLDGIAKEWYNAHRGDVWSWNDLKIALKHAFPNHVNEAKIHFEMQKFVRPKDMQYEVYVYRMMELAKPAKLSTTAIVTYVVRGLNNVTIQNRLKGEFFESCQDLINFIKRYDAANLEDEEGERKASDWRLGEGDIRCNYCNNKGHFARDCRARAAAGRREQSTVTRQPVQGLQHHPAPAKEVGVAVIDEVFFEPTDMRFAGKPFDACSNATQAIRFITPNLYELREIAISFGIKNQVSTVLIEDFRELNDLLREVQILGSFVNNQVDNVIVTLGSYGVAIIRKESDQVPFFDANGNYQAPSREGQSQMRFYHGRKLEEIVNVSGAGDSFTSGFVAAMLERQPEPVCVAVGFEAACCALGAKGAVAEYYFDRRHPCWQFSNAARFITVE